jgi:Tfp pilus assembly protein PilO
MNLPTQRYSQDLRKYYRLPAVQTSLTLVLSLFVMAGFILFALRPTIVSIVTLKKTIIESESSLQQLDIKVANLQIASNQLEANKPFLAILNTNIPNSGAMYSPLTSTIESLSIQNNTKLDSESLGSTLLFSRILSPFKLSKNQSVVALPFTIRVNGNYPDVTVFLTQLLSMERIVSVDSVTITKEAATKTTGTMVALNVSGSAYYLADETQLQEALATPKGIK